MPTISVAKISRKYNLGNFETMEIGLEAFVGEGENVYDVLAGLEGAIGTYMQTHHAEALKPQVQASPQVQPQPQPTKMIQLNIQNQLEKLKKPFGDLADLLSFTVKDGKVLVKPRQFLGAENFSRVANIVRGLQGQYISEGKNSRFELPLPTQ